MRAYKLVLFPPHPHSSYAALSFIFFNPKEEWFPRGSP